MKKILYLLMLCLIVVSGCENSLQKAYKNNVISAVNRYKSNISNAKNMTVKSAQVRNPNDKDSHWDFDYILQINISYMEGTSPVEKTLYVKVEKDGKYDPALLAVFGQQDIRKLWNELHDVPYRVDTLGMEKKIQ